ncbi:hypothetical protein NMY22_g18460 [Coprinellus aureogranulatus]|nr:hypothetical protein NMY22_g18460 [Coprinellus aureogranulatus]
MYSSSTYVCIIVYAYHRYRTPTYRSASVHLGVRHQIPHTPHNRRCRFSPRFPGCDRKQTPCTRPKGRRTPYRVEGNRGATDMCRVARMIARAGAIVRGGCEGAQSRAGDDLQSPAFKVQAVTEQEGRPDCLAPASNPPYYRIHLGTTACVGTNAKEPPAKLLPSLQRASFLLHRLDEAEHQPQQRETPDNWDRNREGVGGKTGVFLPRDFILLNVLQGKAENVHDRTYRNANAKLTTEVAHKLAEYISAHLLFDRVVELHGCGEARADVVRQPKRSSYVGKQPLLEPLQDINKILLGLRNFNLQPEVRSTTAHGNFLCKGLAGIAIGMGIESSPKAVQRVVRNIGAVAFYIRWLMVGRDIHLPVTREALLRPLVDDERR